jgi:hypothetical protein
MESFAGDGNYSFRSVALPLENNEGHYRTVLPRTEQT